MSAAFVCFLALLNLGLVFGNLPGFSTDSTTVQEEIVNVHNAFRRAVQPTASNMLKMSWSAAAAKSAQDWVNTCSMRHGPPSTRMIGDYECGENLLEASALVTWTEVIQAWHSEVKNYQYPNGSANGGMIGHYTQVVWYSSYEVGCGVAACGGSKYFYGCHYYRAGNFRRVAPYTVGTPCADCPNACDDKLCTNPCPYINKYINCPALKREAGCGNPSSMPGVRLCVFATTRSSRQGRSDSTLRLDSMAPWF